MLEVITGCMFAGKTNAFIERVKNLQNEGKNVVVLKPIQDTRYSRNDVVSHDGIKVKGFAVDSIDEIYEIIEEEACDVLAIDEVQFFGWDLLEIINEIANREILVIAAGVDLDFKGKPFGIMPELMAYSDVLVKKHAKCKVCGNIATRSQRLLNGVPAKISDAIVLTGVNENITYESRCRYHHEIRI